MVLTAADLALMAADVAAIVAEHGHDIVIRRAAGGIETTLPAQRARVAATGKPGESSGLAAQEARTGVVVVGDAALDIAPGDRFNADGRLYRVTGVHPDRRAFTQATAELVQ